MILLSKNQMYRISPLGQNREERMKNRKSTVFATLIVSLLFLANCGMKNQENPAPPVLTSVEVAPLSPSIAPGTTVQMKAFGRYSSSAKTDVTSNATWTSSNLAIATVDTHGLVSAALSTTGTATISASYGGLSGSTVLTSSDLASIAVSPEDKAIASRTTIQYSATGTLANAMTQNISSFVTWGATPANVAGITNSGLATAGTMTGTATITAVFSGITGSTSLISADVASIAIAPPDTSIFLGTTQQYSATGTLMAGGSPTQDLTSWATWTSSLSSVATISNSGLAISQATGTTFITASYSLVTSNSATLVVKPAQLKTISVTPVSASVALGRTQQFIATGNYSDGTNQDLTSDVSWISSNTTVATISNTAGSNGLATAKAVGTTAISAQFSGVTSNSVTLTATPAELVSITVLPANPTVSISATTLQQFLAAGLFTDNSIVDLTKSVTWGSSNTFVATFNIPNIAGLANILTAGTTTISATSGIISGNTLLTVTFF